MWGPVLALGGAPVVCAHLLQLPPPFPPCSPFQVSGHSPPGALMCAGASPRLWQQFQQPAAWRDPGSCRKRGEVGSQLPGSPSPGRRGPDRQQDSALPATSSLAPSPNPWGAGSEGRAKGEGMGFVCWCPSITPPHIPPCPGCARVHPSAPLPARWGQLCSLLRGAVFSETVGDVVCVKLALPC